MTSPASIPVHPSGRQPRLPTFLVIGAMKAGTTSLYHYLRSHPNVFMPSVKELGYFTTDPGLSRGLDWYKKQFGGAGAAALALGEASTMYTKYPRYPGVPARIARVIPKASLVYVIRDPIDRIRSHYQHRFSIGAEGAPIEEAVLNDSIYVDCSRYAMQIEQYLDHFPREQLLIITSEDLRNHGRETLKRVYRFIGVDEEHVPPSVGHEYYRSETRVAYPPIAWFLRDSIKRVFPKAKRLKELFDSPNRSGARAPLSFMSRHLMRRHASAKPSPIEMSESLRDQLREMLHEDTTRLRSHVAQGLEAWATQPS